MSNDQLGFLSSEGAGNSAPQDIEVAGVRRDMHASTDYSNLLPAERDQLERDIAAIERASAALRRAEPALQSWSGPPAKAVQKPRPLWLLIGVLWLSTALVTLGAVFVISALVG